MLPHSTYLFQRVGAVCLDNTWPGTYGAVTAVPGWAALAIGMMAYTLRPDGNVVQQQPMKEEQSTTASTLVSDLTAVVEGKKGSQLAASGLAALGIAMVASKLRPNAAQQPTTEQPTTLDSSMEGIVDENAEPPLN